MIYRIYYILLEIRDQFPKMLDASTFVTVPLIKEHTNAQATFTSPSHVST